MNIVNLIGRLVKDPEIKYLSSGKAVCKFTLAVNRFMNGENSADFINCTVFGATAENLGKYQKKGGQIAVEGNIKTGSYDDPNGVKRYTTEVWVEKIHYLSKVESNGTSQGNNTQATNNTYQQNKEQFKQQDKENPFENVDDFKVTNEDLPF